MWKEDKNWRHLLLQVLKFKIFVTGEVAAFAQNELITEYACLVGR